MFLFLTRSNNPLPLLTTLFYWRILSIRPPSVSEWQKGGEKRGKKTSCSQISVRWENLFAQTINILFTAASISYEAEQRNEDCSSSSLQNSLKYPQHNHTSSHHLLFRIAGNKYVSALWYQYELTTMLKRRILSCFCTHSLKFISTTFQLRQTNMSCDWIKAPPQTQNKPVTAFYCVVKTSNCYFSITKLKLWGKCSHWARFHLSLLTSR